MVFAIVGLALILTFAIYWHGVATSNCQPSMGLRWWGRFYQWGGLICLAIAVIQEVTD